MTPAPSNQCTERKLPTKAKWAEFDRTLSRPYESIKLMVDGYKLRLATVMEKRTVVIQPYINDTFKGAWLFDDCEERRRFLRKSTKHLYTKKERDERIKAAKSLRPGKATIARVQQGLNKTFDHWHVNWSTPATLRRHLIANNHNIEIVDEWPEP
jgi:hypothetical protein